MAYNRITWHYNRLAAGLRPDLLGSLQRSPDADQLAALSGEGRVPIFLPHLYANDYILHT